MVQQGSVFVGPSILAADFGHLAQEAQRIAAAGADYLHVDVMDGHFVPNLTMGPQVVEALNCATDLFLDVHLMIYQPYDYIERFVAAGAKRITIHFEATEDVADTLSYIRKCNVEAGLAFCPETSQSMVLKYLDKCDLILMMTVHPGFGGQQFMPEVLEKVRFVREVSEKLRIGAHGKSYDSLAAFEAAAPLAIQVDGGVDALSAPLCIHAGANYLVSGNYLFKQPDMAKAIAQLRGGLQTLSGG